jgi:hypothetical protein
MCHLATGKLFYLDKTVNNQHRVRQLDARIELSIGLVRVKLNLNQLSDASKAEPGWLIVTDPDDTHAAASVTVTL